MNHGDGHFQERSPLSLNGKRPLEPDSVLSREHTDHNGSKRSKTLPLPNGLESSAGGVIQPIQTSAIRNGYNEIPHDTQSETKECIKGDQLNGDEVKPAINTEGVGNSTISNETTLTNNANSDLTDEKEGKLPAKGAATTEGCEVTETSEGTPGGAEPEIITLSDSEDEFQEVLTQAISRNSSNLKVVQLLKLYQDQLRVEESKLILLRKLKESVTNANRSSSSTSTEAGSKLPDAKSAIVASQRGNGGNAPPPLKRGHQQPPHGLPNQSQPSHPKTTHHHHATVERGKGTHISSSTNSAGPPPLVNMAKSSSHTSAGNSGSYNGYQAASVSQPKKASPAPPKLTSEQTLMAAKLALRKQLEQALQQVPAPKPPPPEVNFLPSLASGEFIYLIGMEEVVKQLLSTDQKDVKFVFNPFSCVQCDADFTPVWKRDKPGSKNVICEKCITSNQKQVLKQEHTAKLKAVFSKALLKEQEIERRVAAGSPLSDMPGLAATVVRQQQPSTAATAATPSMPQLTAQHAQSSPSPNSQQLSTSQLHQQALRQAQAEQMRALLAAQMLPYQLYSGVGVTSKQAADIQRQYLLDMINQNRSSSSWKT